MLKQNALTMEEIWRRDVESEIELDIRYRSEEDDIHHSPSSNPEATGSRENPESIQSDDSKNVPLALTPKAKDSPRKIYPSEIHFTLGDKTTKFIKSRKNIARKSLARKTKEPRHTLAPQWNIIQDGTITGYTPHTITIDTPLRKNTVIRKNDLAIVTEKKPIKELTKELQKPRIIHMVACKTVGEYKRNQEKNKKFCLDEAKQLKTANKEQIGETSQRASTRNNKPDKRISNWSPAKVRRTAAHNQKKQQKTKSPVNPKSTTNWLKQYRASKRPRSQKVSPGQIFEQRSKLVALQNSEEHAVNRSFLNLDIDSIEQTHQTVTYLIESETSSPQKILTSSDPKEFMITSPESPPIHQNQEATSRKEQESVNFISSKSTRRKDIAVTRIQALNEETPNLTKPQVIFLDTDNNEQDKQTQYKAIQLEQEKLEREQANLISIIPAPQITQQEDTTDIIKSHETNTPAPKENTNNEDEHQLANKIQTKLQYSVTSSTTSQEYRTPPLSPNIDEISHINTEDLEELNETP